MLILSYVYHALESFRQVFSRRRTWILFCVAMLAFIGAPEVTGVSSLCRFWHMEESGYHALLAPSAEMQQIRALLDPTPEPTQNEPAAA